jgi:hypothetical protein
LASIRGEIPSVGLIVEQEGSGLVDAALIHTKRIERHPVLLSYSGMPDDIGHYSTDFDPR